MAELRPDCQPMSFVTITVSAPCIITALHQRLTEGFCESTNEWLKINFCYRQISEIVSCLQQTGQTSSGLTECTCSDVSFLLLLSRYQKERRKIKINCHRRPRSGMICFRPNILLRKKERKKWTVIKILKGMLLRKLVVHFVLRKNRMREEKKVNG